MIHQIESDTGVASGAHHMRQVSSACEELNPLVVLEMQRNQRTGALEHGLMARGTHKTIQIHNFILF